MTDIPPFTGEIKDFSVKNGQVTTHRPLSAKFKIIDVTGCHLLIWVQNRKSELKCTQVGFPKPCPLNLPPGSLSYWHIKLLFDQTCGFPGEGPQKKRWSKEIPNFKMTTWNPRSVTQERFEYCEEMDYDILVLPEL